MYNLEIVNDLVRNIHEGDYGQEGEVYFSLFEKYITLFNWHGADDTYVMKCAHSLNNLSEVVIDHLCIASIRYCNDFLAGTGQEPKQFNTSRDILPLIYPSSLSVPNTKDPAIPVIHMELNCEWEEEHGMEWIIRNDKVLYVGAYNGSDPWGEFEPKDSWNYA
jgi:hypothetical protein